MAIIANWIICRDQRDEIRAEDRADPSLDFDEPWPTSQDKYIIENGRLYDQATLELTVTTQLVLPADRGAVPPGIRVNESINYTLRTDGQPGVIRMLLEKRRYYFGHHRETWRLIGLRERFKIWKHQTGTELVLDVDAGGSTPHGGTEVHAIFILPANFPVRREPVSGPLFAGRYEDGFCVPDEKRKVAGWQEVPQQPLPKTEWPLPIERPHPMGSSR